MEVYALDSLFRRIAVYDKFESLVWTERWQELGDFELDVISTLENRSQFTTGTKLAINNSYRVMTVETVEDNTDEEGKATLRIKGRSLEHILEDRVAKSTMSHLTPTWVLQGPPADVAREMFDAICRDGVLSLDDKIPFLQPGTIFPASTIPEPGSSIRWEQQPDSLFNAIQALCKMYDLGFRLVRNFDTSQLYFDIYTGTDRTTLQQTLAPVVFSANLDNLENTTEFNSIQKSKNVAYVFSEFGSAVVFGENVDPDIEGFDRRVLVVQSSAVDQDTPPEDIQELLEQDGRQELAKNRAITLFDGEINQNNSSQVYGVDYDLGDLVELRNKDGVRSFKRATEQIFVSDSEGDRAYPTLALDQFAGTNTWNSWNTKETKWVDMTTEQWADM